MREYKRHPAHRYWTWFPYLKSVTIKEESNSFRKANRSKNRIFGFIETEKIIINK